MSKYLQIALGLAALTVAGSICFVSWRLSVALDKWGDGGAQTFAGLNQALTTVNRPCTDKNGCGTLGQVGKATVRVGDLLVTSQLQERDIAKAAQSNMAAVNSLADHLNKTADALTDTSKTLSGTSVAATETLQQAHTDLGTLNSTIAGLQPLEASLTSTANASTATINTFNGRLSDPHIESFIAHLDSTTGHIDATTGDLQKVADKTTGDILAPKPWWQKIGPYGNDLVRAGCLLTGRCP